MSLELALEGIRNKALVAGHEVKVELGDDTESLPEISYFESVPVSNLQALLHAEIDQKRV